MSGGEIAWIIAAVAFLIIALAIAIIAGSCFWCDERS